MTYQQVYTIQEQNEILREGGELAITKLYTAYEKQINDYVVRIMLSYGQKLYKVKIEDCQSAVKVKVCEIILKKPVLTADFMAYIQEAVRHTVEYELFGQDHIVRGERNAMKRAKVMKVRDILIRSGNVNPSPEDIFQELNRFSKNRGKTAKGGNTYPDITVRFIRNILIQTVSLDDFSERTMPASEEKGPEQQAQDDEFSRAVQRVLAALDEQDRKILKLQEDELTQKEIAKKLEMEIVAYRNRKSILETYLAAALMTLGYQDVCGVALHKFEVVVSEFDSNIRPVLSSMNAEEQRELLGILSGKKKRGGGKYSEKIMAVLACLAGFDKKCGEKFGYGQIYHRIIQ